jgi:Fic family protein
MIIDNASLLQQLEYEKKSFSELKKSELLFKAFWDDFKVRFCWSSNAIEGNTLTLDETIEIVLYDEVRSGHTYSEYTKAKQLYKAICEQISTEKNDITENWIKKCNAIIRKDEGEYRTKDVYIGTVVEATYFPTSPENIKKEMDLLLPKVNFNSESLEETIKKIAEFHIQFERIHPFGNGNGRTGRMILNQQLINHDLLPVAVDKTSKYRQAFRIYDRNKDTSMLEHILYSSELQYIGEKNCTFSFSTQKVTKSNLYEHVF